jgi:hypothetical protein
MLVDFSVVIGVVSIPGTWQNKQLFNVPFSTIITKDILGKNVPFTSFVARIATIVVRR